MSSKLPTRPCARRSQVSATTGCSLPRSTRPSQYSRYMYKRSKSDMLAARPAAALKDFTGASRPKVGLPSNQQPSIDACLITVPSTDNSNASEPPRCRDSATSPSTVLKPRTSLGASAYAPSSPRMQRSLPLQASFSCSGHPSSRTWCKNSDPYAAMPSISSQEYRLMDTTSPSRPASLITASSSPDSGPTTSTS